MVNLDIMHNLILKALKDHATYKLDIPESSIKKKSTVKIESSDSDSDTSSSSNPKSLEREVRSLQRDVQQKAKNVFSSSSNLPGGSPIHYPQLKQILEDPSENLSSFDPDYVPTSDLPSEFYFNKLFSCEPLRYDQISKKVTRKLYNNYLKISENTINRHKLLITLDSNE
ncbi:hypothetical protein O181_068467 [Austropuccinia psidii MF-1]|uniref:Uncharacterized protein n=1 Tax=Austropuccinia psidii MF-1 TaxID=1389203 RepID=A0A9Q3F2H9_9BASI|nr:hypothetical protein [Austropuccinia psidii MF-1]